MVDEPQGEVPAVAEAHAAPTIRWDAASMRSSYANVCTVTSTRDHIVLLFGLERPRQAGRPEVRVELMDSIILSPLAGKRVATLLDRVMREYESRFGTVRTEPPASSLSS